MASYLLLDGARMGGHLYTAKDFNGEYLPLYRPDTEKDLEDLGPFLFSLKDNNEFLAWFEANGLGQSWGVSLETDATAAELCTHFRQFLIVAASGGEHLYFRFYDPRVLRIFLPTCTPKQVEEFFGPVETFLVEDAGGRNLIEFSHHRGTLRQKEINSTAKASVSNEPTSQRKTRRRTIVDDDLAGE